MDTSHSTLESPNGRKPLPEPLAHLSAADPVLARMIAQCGPLHLTSTEDYFFTLVDSIANQQISTKAAETIVARIRALTPGKATISAEDILGLEEGALRGAGLSGMKVAYVKDLANHVVTGKLHLESIARMEDEQIISELVAVKGIGRWTAEMFLMFALGRKDVLAVDDYGLRTSMKRLYSLPELPKPAQMREIAEPWRPYRSYGCLYLWKCHDGSK